ncbi:MAG: OmpA family protein [Deltaproteobacteria bacterium]|nr:OmpA family protein [Deltaproteobacteria bacterium]
MNLDNFSPKQFRFPLLVLLVTVLTACCPSSRVVLLDSGKTANAVVVKTTGGEVLLDQPNTYTELAAADQQPAPARKLTPDEIEKRYGKILRAAPKPPASFLLYFKAGATELTENSRQLLPRILAAIRKRAPCEISIIGHCDRTGSREYNIRLSLARAQAVHEWLKTNGAADQSFKVESYGEEDPLILTPDGVAEPRNRRVEILIR